MPICNLFWQDGDQMAGLSHYFLLYGEYLFTFLLEILCFNNPFVDICKFWGGCCCVWASQTLCFRIVICIIQRDVLVILYVSFCCACIESLRSDASFKNLTMLSVLTQLKMSSALLMCCCSKHKFRISEYTGHTIRKWLSSSTTPRSQTLHTLSCLGIFLCLPISISNLWLEHRNLDRICLFLKDGMLR